MGNGSSKSKSSSLLSSSASSKSSRSSRSSSKSTSVSALNTLCDSRHAMYKHELKQSGGKGVPKFKQRTALPLLNPKVLVTKTGKDTDSSVINNSKMDNNDKTMLS
mmetsp:Transcript_52138/g.59137  ORF Transcript_52138/g.59137 Transcript_52138/m.59137 type:complete len:106 (+) Transcript_52138:91-408(+)